MVHFVGAGPGAPDLITRRGAALLQKADCIIYAGSLVNPALLGLALLALQLRGLVLGLGGLVQIVFHLAAQILRRRLIFQQLIRQVHRRQHRRVRLAHMQGIQHLAHPLVHQCAYLLHICRALVCHQGILLAADVHCHLICHVILLFM